MPDVTAARAKFRKLHESGCFILPNPWDVSSARWLEGAGFEALASTSSGFAWSQGKADGVPSLDEVIEHLTELCAATDLPVNADFEHGFAKDHAGLAKNVRACINTGVAGLSIEDSTGDATQPLFDFDDAVARMKVARTTIDDSGQDVMLVGRAECFLTGHADPLNECLARLKAYADAGADCLYAPGLKTREQIVAIVEAVAPKPVNILIGAPLGFSRDELAGMGVRRISLGGALARSAWGGFLRATEALKEGRFDALSEAASGAALNGFFSASR